MEDDYTRPLSEGQPGQVELVGCEWAWEAAKYATQEEDALKDAFEAAATAQQGHDEGQAQAQAQGQAQAQALAQAQTSPLLTALPLVKTILPKVTLVPTPTMTLIFTLDLALAFTIPLTFTLHPPPSPHHHHQCPSLCFRLSRAWDKRPRTRSYLKLRMILRLGSVH